MIVNALLDLGLGATLIQSSLYVQLGLTSIPTELNLKWADSITHHPSFVTQLEVQVPNTEKTFFLSGIKTFNRLDLPPQTQTREGLWEHENLRDKPFPEFTNVKPCILIGLPHARLCVDRKVVAGFPHEPISDKTALGWVLYGSYG